MMADMLLIEDEKIVLARELKKLKDEMDSLKQTYLRLDTIHKIKKLRYEEIDKSRALKDGRLKLVTITPKKKEEKKLTKDEILAMIEDLEKMIK